MGPDPDFGAEYLPALFLYCLAVTKYYQDDVPRPTQLVFVTASVLGQYVLSIGKAEPKPGTSVTQSVEHSEETQEAAWDMASIRQHLDALEVLN